MLKVNSFLPFSVLGLIALVSILGCSNPTSSSSTTQSGTGVLQAGTTPRTNVAGDDYHYALSGYYTYAGQTAHLGTLSGTSETFYTLDPTMGTNILKATTVLTINLSDGETSTQTGSTWYTISGSLYWDGTNGKVTAISGNSPSTYSSGISWVISITYANGVSTTSTSHVLGAYDVTCPYGVVKAAWEEQITSSAGAVSYAYYAPSIGSAVSLSVAIGSSSYTIYPTFLLSSYSLGN